VGQAERFDEFKEEEIREFHQNITDEERQRQVQQLGEQMNIQAGETGDAQESVTEDLEELRSELLRIPKRDRVKIGLDGQYTLETNVPRLPPQQEKGDSIFDTNGFVEFDLGGKKTDLRLEFRGGKQWNVKFPTSDFWQVEERIRFRRKYFKKLTHSIQSRIARHSSKTIEVDSKKIRYDSNQTTTLNYVLSRKLSLNTELGANKRLFTTEPFDQDSQWDVLMAPSLFWNFTPKSRISLGYRFGASRIRTKTGDANSQEVHAGYFGRVTRKSSLSFDASFSHQTPRSLDTATVNTLKLGIGYILQLTPKTQMTVQAIRSVQNSSSNLVSGTENETVKMDEHFTHDNLTVSLNSRLNRKITAIGEVGISHFRNKVSKTGDEDNETRQFTVPLTLTVNYMITRSIQYRLRYTFSFRTGNEQNDYYRAHQLMTGVNMTF